MTEVACVFFFFLPVVTLVFKSSFGHGGAALVARLSAATDVAASSRTSSGLAFRPC